MISADVKVPGMVFDIINDILFSLPDQIPALIRAVDAEEVGASTRFASALRIHNKDR